MALAITLQESGRTLTNITNFSVQEDATPIEPSSSFGGVGRIQFDSTEITDATTLVGAVTLVAGTAGKTSGTIRDVSGTDGLMSVVSDSAMTLYNTSRTVPPYVGTLGGAIAYYSDLVGITNDVVMDTSVTSRSVIYPGWTGNVWVYLKQILIAEQVEMALVFDRIYVRPLRALTATLARSKTLAWAVNSGEAAQTVEIYYYNNTYGTQREVYPVNDGNDPSIYAIDANATQVFQVQLNASMVSVNQPVAMDFVNDETYAGTNGVYAVTGSDNLPITAAQWTAQGGSVSVAITDDPSIIEITVRGATMTDYSPYRIAMSSGSGNDYNSLHITGTAVVWDKQLLVLPTGAPTAITSDTTAPTIDNQFINTYEAAMSLGIRAAQAHSGINYTLTGSALNVNRDGLGTELIQSTILDFNAKWSTGPAISVFSTEWSGQDIAAFNDYWQARVDGLFSNQLFGNAPGARVPYGDAYFRIDSVTTTQDSAQFNATLDTLVADFSEVWASGTIADFNTQFSGRTTQDFATIPLRRN